MGDLMLFLRVTNDHLEGVPPHLALLVNGREKVLLPPDILLHGQANQSLRVHVEFDPGYRGKGYSVKALEEKLQVACIAILSIEERVLWHLVVEDLTDVNDDAINTVLYAGRVIEHVVRDTGWNWGSGGWRLVTRAGPANDDLHSRSCNLSIRIDRSELIILTSFVRLGGFSGDALRIGFELDPGCSRNRQAIHVD